jgi:hypothetical protein
MKMASFSVVEEVLNKLSMVTDKASILSEKYLTVRRHHISFRIHYITSNDYIYIRSRLMNGFNVLHIAPTSISHQILILNGKSYE